MKRTISIILCLLLVMAMLPTAALADDTLGGITITGGQSGTDYTISGSCLTIESSAALTISGSEADFRIVVAGGKTANLTLSDATVDMSASTFAAIDLENGAKLNLTISGVNTLKGGAKCAGISAPEGTTLSISGSGTLNVFGGTFGAGIGGGTVTLANAAHPEYEFYGADAGTINISGGTVNATGGQWAAGIGGGAGFERENGNVVGGSGGAVTIGGGTVNASAGVGGIHPTHGEFGGSAGIGGGGALGYKLGGAGGSITISGGTVNADSVDSDNLSVGGGAAIGGGYRGEAGNITISAGTVVAEAGLGGAGIGSGSFCEGGGVIKISAGSVTATGGKSAAGIGTGWTDGMGSTPPTEIVISGGRVTATGGNGLVHPTRGTMGAGAGIGGGYWNVGSDVTISGGIVSATGGGLSGAYDDNSTVPSAIGAGSNNSGTHSFSTGQSGSAVINAKAPATPSSGYITDQSNKANWLGTIFEGTSGQVYGSQTVNNDFTIDAGQTLTIPAADSLTIADGVTITNNGSIVNNGLSRNNGTIAGSGTVTCNNHNWDAATYSAPKTCAFCKITEGEHLPRVRYGIMEGADEIYQDDKIYFGKYTESNTDYDVPWVVLNENSGSAFLLSEYMLGNSQFQASGSGYYKGSTLNAKMDELYNSGANTLFTSNERGLIVAKTNLNCVDGQYDDQSSPVVPTAYLYPLSYNEAAAQSWGAAEYRNDGSTGSWWLRSSMMDDEAYCVSSDRPADASRAQRTNGVRPAMNLNTSEVLFTSAAVGGKAGNGALAAVGTGVTNELKLTLLDNADGSGRENFDITATALSAASATVDYTGAKTGTNEYISAVIVDNGSVIYYGRIMQLDGTTNGSSGTATINIPLGATLDEDTQLKVFNEQFNGDRSATDDTAMAYTDYASELRLVTAPPIYSISAAPETLSFGSVQTGYTQPEAQTVTVTNTGNQSVTVTLPTLANYSITAGTGFTGTTAVLSANGNTATFTVQPNASLGTGTYTGTIAITGSNNVSYSVEAVFEVVSAQTVATPVFSPDGGTYTGTQSVTLSCSTVDATIRYTTNGNEPTEASTAYVTGKPITVSATTTIKAKAFKSGMTASTVASATYTITITPPSDPDPIEYQITKGTNGKWTKGDSNGLGFTVDAGYSKFIDVSVDSSTISSDKFNSESGSTIITLKASYLQTLSVGQHTLRINFTDGYAETHFTIKAAGDSDIPTTGDNSQSWLWLGIALIAGAGLVGSLLMLYRRQRQNNHR